MSRLLFGVALVFHATGAAVADDAGPIASDLPPVLGVAIAGGDQPEAVDDEWTVRLTLPRVTWQVVGEAVPKREWPTVQSVVEQHTQMLRMGGPSALAPSRIVDLVGRELTREEVMERLEIESPVLVSLSGRMIEEYYLQLTVADALIVILGPRDGAPCPELLATQGAMSAPSENDQ